MSNWSELRSRVRVGADPVERDVAEVEQTAPADDDVEPEREQHVDARCRTRPAGRSRCRRPTGTRRRARRTASARPTTGTTRRRSSSVPSGPPRPARLLAVPRDPLVAADGRARRPFRRRRLERALERPGQLVVVAAAHRHTFLMSALPRRPCGRNEHEDDQDRRRRARSDQRVEM